MGIRILVVSAMCTVVALAGLPTSVRAGERDASASAFAVRTVRLLVENRYAAAWPSLHPSHQRAVGGREVYVRCELTAPIVVPVTAVEGLAVRNETTSIAGLGRVRTKAVAIRVTFAGPGATHPDDATVMLNVHVLLVNGKWHWVLPNSRYVSYRRGTCG